VDAQKRGGRHREKNKEKKQKRQRKLQEKTITKNPTKKKTFTKKKEGARPNPKLAAAAPSPQFFPLFFTGLKPAIKRPS